MTPNVSHPLKFLICAIVFSLVGTRPSRSEDGSHGTASPARTEIRSQIQKIEVIAETCKDDPAFAQWLTYQHEILTRSLEETEKNSAGDEPPENDRERQNLLRGITDTVALRQKYREAQQTNPQKTFNVRDYGALGDAVANDAPAIRKTIEAAQAYPNSRVYLPAGTYRLGDLDHTGADTPSPCFSGCDVAPEVASADLAISKPPHLSIRQAANLVISGDGLDKTTLLAGVAWETGIAVENSQNVSIEDLAFDCEKLPFTQGNVTKIIDDKTYDVSVDTGCPSPLDPHIFKARFGMVTRNFVKDGENIVPLPGKKAPSYLTLSKIRRLADGTYRFTVGSSSVHTSSAARARELPVGSLFVLYGRVSNEQPAIKFDSVQNCKLSNVGIFSSFSAGILVKRSGLVEIDSCKIMPRPGALHIASTNADGVFCQSNYLSPYIHDCYMTLSGDDFVNTQSNALAIEDFNENTFYCKVNGHSNFMPGQHLTAVETGTWRRDYSSVIRKTTVRKIKGELMLEIEMEDAIPPGIGSRKSLGTASGGKIDRLLNLDVTGPGCVVADNQLIYGFRLILRSSNALVANNRIVNRHGSGNFIILGVHALEGWKADNITIRNNTIDGLGNIVFAPQVPVPNHNILIKQNTIVDPEIKSDSDVFPVKLFDQYLNREVRLLDNVYPGS